jgi:hypothetical protein
VVAELIDMHTQFCICEDCLKQRAWILRALDSLDAKVTGWSNQSTIVKLMYCGHCHQLLAQYNKDEIPWGDLVECCFTHCEKWNVVALEKGNVLT